MTVEVLVVEDDLSLREAICDTLMIAGYPTHPAENAKKALQVLINEKVDLVISDIQMGEVDGITLLKKIKEKYPELPVILMTAYGTIEQAVNAMHEGATDYLVKPFEPEVLVSRVAQFDYSDINENDGFIAVDSRSREVMELANKVANNNVTVMVTGESGAGKEVLVRYIHMNSERRDKPFVAINCAAIPDNMLEAMLFGYQKGAFTGAYKSSPGKFEQAQGGTLLLDEISEMSLGLQAKLLRVLQEREVERLGDQKLIELDVRVMATSNRNMREEVETGRFREDLFYRLNVFPISMPALCERPDDIIPIAEYLLKRHSEQNKEACPILNNDAKEKILLHDWPGNVRELDNVIQRAIVLQVNGTITAKDIHFEVAEKQSSEAKLDLDDYAADPDSLGHDLKVREQRIILDALKEASGSRKDAAEKLGISPRTLRYKLARMRDDGVEIPMH